MRRHAFALTCALLALASPGCHDATDATLNLSSSTTVSLAVAPDPVLAGYPATFTVAAKGNATRVRSVSIDFTGDGSFDEVRTFDIAQIAPTFTHIYAAAAVYDVKVEVRDAAGVVTPITRSTPVREATDVPVYVVVAATSRDSRSSCYAEGPPATCDGCRAPVAFESLRVSVGPVDAGTPVSVTQRFTSGPEWPCDFNLALIAGPPGLETTIARGACSGDCSVTATGVVP